MIQLDPHTRLLCFDTVEEAIAYQQALDHPPVLTAEPVAPADREFIEARNDLRNGSKDDKELKSYFNDTLAPRFIVNKLRELRTLSSSDIAAFLGKDTARGCVMGVMKQLDKVGEEIGLKREDWVEYERDSRGMGYWTAASGLKKLQHALAER